MPKKTLITASVLFAVTVLISIAAFLRLPDTVITQFSITGGNVTTMSKPLAVGIASVIGIGGSVMCFLGKDYTKSTILSAAGIAILAVMLAVNS
ncbi:MAG: hypothetical protein EOM64_00980 [Erysipelotrichia bacterium]|nr:hypothetical protein [Erysipelotrichia bacterium]